MKREPSSQQFDSHKLGFSAHIKVSSYERNRLALRTLASMERYMLLRLDT